MLRWLLKVFSRRPRPEPPPEARAAYWAVYETTERDFHDNRPPGRFVMAWPTAAAAFLFVQECNRQLQSEGEAMRYVTRLEPAALVHCLIEEMRRKSDDTTGCCGE